MNHSSRSYWKIILAIILLIIILLFFKWCLHPATPPPTVWVADSTMIIWKDPAATTTAFQNWLGKFKDSVRLQGEITDSAFCPTCDSTLIRIKGRGPQIYMQQQLSGGSGGSPTQGVGRDGPAYYCSNLVIHAPDQVRLRATEGLINDSMYYFFGQGKTQSHLYGTPSIYPQPQAPAPATMLAPPG